VSPPRLQRSKIQAALARNVSGCPKRKQKRKPNLPSQKGGVVSRPERNCRRDQVRKTEPLARGKASALPPLFTASQFSEPRQSHGRAGPAPAGARTAYHFLRFRHWPASSSAELQRPASPGPERPKPGTPSPPAPGNPSSKRLRPNGEALCVGAPSRSSKPTPPRQKNPNLMTSFELDNQLGGRRRGSGASRARVGRSVLSACDPRSPASFCHGALKTFSRRRCLFRPAIGGNHLGLPFNPNASKPETRPCYRKGAPLQ